MSWESVRCHGSGQLLVLRHKAGPEQSPIQFDSSHSFLMNTPWTTPQSSINQSPKNMVAHKNQKKAVPALASIRSRAANPIIAVLPLIISALGDMNPSASDSTPLKIGIKEAMEKSATTEAN